MTNPPRRATLLPLFALALAPAMIVFAATAPTLGWLEFSSGSENLNVATALEIRRTGNWLMPTLQGQQRIAKPPLTAWITASLLSADSLAKISSIDPSIRDQGYRELYWQIRWPALLASCLTLVIVFELGRIIGGLRLGFASAIVCASTYAFLRFGRAATTDVQLMLWVALANLFLAKALLQQRWWVGCIGAGAALGLAFMSKGPVALVQTIVPAIAFIIVARTRQGSGFRVQGSGEGSGFRVQGSGEESSSLNPELRTLAPSCLNPEPRNLAPLLAGAIVFLLIALPWFLLVALRHPAWSTWWAEVTRRGATDDEPSRWYNYLSLFPMLLPWILFLISGLVLAGGYAMGKAMPRLAPLADPPGSPQRRGIILALFMLVIPILIMSCFQDRKERYLLPMIIPASILAAHGLVVHLRAWSSPRPAERGMAAAHWIIVAVAGIGFPIAAATALRGADGGPWMSISSATAAAGASLLVLLLGLALRRRTEWSMPLATLLVILIVQTVFVHGYARSFADQSEMLNLANRIRAAHPDAILHSYRPGRRAPEDLSIYLNRTVHPEENPHALAPHPERPRILVVFQRQGHPLPPIPDGWEHVDVTEHGKNLWHAYRMEKT